MSRRTSTVALMLTMLLILMGFPAGAAEMKVANHSFEEGLGENGFPVGWPSAFSSPAFGLEMTLSEAQAYDGKTSVRIEDRSASANVGLRSAMMPVKEGYTYTATVQAYNETGAAQFYLEFWDANGTRIDTGLVGSSVPQSWHTLQVRRETPKGAVGATLLVYSHNANIGVTYYDNATLYEEDPNLLSPISPIAHIKPAAFDLSAAPLGVTSLEAVRAKVPDAHPRLFVTPDTLEDLRDKRNRSALARLIWTNINNSALALSFSPMPPYPPHASPGGVFDVTLWREGINIAGDIVNRLDTVGFAYLISGNQMYGDAAKKLLVHVASWDPNDTTSRSANDEISMRLLYSMSRAYDWLYDALTPEERLIVQKSMRERGNDVYIRMRSINFENTLLDNHLVRTIGFLGQAAIAFLGEIPEAEVWFDYVVGIMLVKYPQFGGDEGGWSQGVSYWQSYISWTLEYLDALRIATGLDLYQKPFFRNTAYFKLYSHPPKSKVGAFGDHSDVAPNSGSANVVGRFALAYKDSALQWYASQISALGRVPAIPTNTFYGYVLVPEDTADMVDPALPEDFPQSRLFSDVGWALMNVDMADWSNNVHVKFKSSPYGSFNHSHAEQNSFMIEAYGSPLAISSGYYPWYGSPHHKTWTWESRSKNTILVNGVGQGVQNINAKGKIIDHSFGSQFDYVAGDAAQAYMGRLNEFIRHMWFIKPNIIAIFDEVATRGTATYDWLLHTEKEMEIDAKRNRVRVPADSAEMWAYFVTPKQLEFSKTDQFTVPPEDREAGKPNQWHLTVKAQSPDGVGRFFTILVPRPAKAVGTPAPEVKAIAATNGYAAELTMDGVQYLLGFRDGEAAPAFYGYQTDGVGLTIWQGAGESGLMFINAKQITQDGKVLVSANQAVTGGVIWRQDGSVLDIQLPEDGTVTLQIAAHAAPAQVFINGMVQNAAVWSFADGVVSIRK
ncbi:MAG: DUF4962 domain-containing protein [Limnochordia bacterium]